MKATGTYVYCLVAAPRRPALGRVRGGLPGAGRIRLIEVSDDDGRTRPRQGFRPLKKWLVVADAPLDRYGEEAINRRLSDLEWVSRAAVGHEAVVESFIDSAALLPMKLFTIFASDERAVEHIRRQHSRIDATLKRVTNRVEWGVRVVLNPMKTAVRSARRTANGRAPREPSGAKYLAVKKAQRDATAELARHAPEVVADLYEALAARATDAARRSASELPVKGGPLLLDAAFLVPRSQSARFRAGVGHRARALASQGYGVTLSGPWPPYSFMRY